MPKVDVNVKDLSYLIQELGTLNKKRNLDKHDERRSACLLAQISAVKAGASLQDIERDNFNDEERRNGLPITEFKTSKLTPEQRDNAAVWQQFVHTSPEQRDVEGSIIPRIGTYSGLGYFVPTDFFEKVFFQMAAHDPLFDEESCTVINAQVAGPLPIPTVGDIESVASIVSEAGSQTETDIAAPNHSLVGAYSYKTPRWTCSIEAFQDLQGVITATSLFTSFASDRLRRGIGADLVTGTGGSVKPLGLVPSLEALNTGVTTPITATGSAANTGGAETGVNTIGQVDLSNLYYSVNSAYRASSKCAWLMNDATLNYLDSIVTKQGMPLGLVKWNNGQPFIMGKPVKISPSVSLMGASQVPMIFGDLSYWVTRIVTGESNGQPTQYVQKYTEAPGLIENGLIGFRAYLRADGTLAANDSGSPSPMNFIRNHS